MQSNGAHFCFRSIFCFSLLLSFVCLFVCLFFRNLNRQKLVYFNKEVLHEREEKEKKEKKKIFILRERSPWSWLSKRHSQAKSILGNLACPCEVGCARFVGDLISVELCSRFWHFQAFSVRPVIFCSLDGAGLSTSTQSGHRLPVRTNHQSQDFLRSDVIVVSRRSFFGQNLPSRSLRCTLAFAGAVLLLLGAAGWTALSGTVR